MPKRITKKSHHINIDVSINITAHKEGDYLFRTLRSIYRNINCLLEGSDAQVEVNIGLDNADEITEQIARNFAKENKKLNVQIFKNSFGDVAVHRNFLIEKSKGTYIAVYDGDDFMSENYLLDAYNEAQKHTEPAVYCAKWLIMFGEHPATVLHHIRSTQDPEFDPVSCYEYNAFPIQLFVHRDVYKKISYQPNQNIYGSEDFNFNLNVQASGYEIYTLPEVLYYYREKPPSESLMHSYILNKKPIRPTKFLNPSFFKKLTIPISQKQDSESSSSKPNIGISYTKKVVKLQLEVFAALLGPLKSKLLNSHTAPVNNDLYSKKISDLKNHGFTQKHFNLWSKVNEIEPYVYYDRDLIINLKYTEYNIHSNLSKIYFDFCNTFDGRISDILVVDEMKDDEEFADDILEILGSLSKQNRRILVIFAGYNSKKAGLYKSKSEVIENFEFTGYNNEQLIDFILKVVQNWSIKSLTISSAKLAHKLLDDYGRILVECTKIVACSNPFLENMQELTLLKYAPSRLQSFVDVALVPDLNSKKRLVEEFGWDDKKLHATERISTSKPYHRIIKEIYSL